MATESKEDPKDTKDVDIRAFAKAVGMEEFLVETENDLKLRLQTALQLELSTLPLYITGYLSFRKDVSGTALEAQKLLRSVFLEEMKHMQTVNNVMVSLWGNNATVIPKGSKDAVPLIGAEYNIDYSADGSLPGGIRPDIKKLDGYPSLLNRCCKEQVYSVYIKIEEPENTKPEKDKPDIFIPDDGKTSVDVYFYKKSQFKTIGQFYRILFEGMKDLHTKGDIKFHADGKGYSQTTAGGLGGKEPPVIKDLATAKQGLDMIIDEGEGSPDMVDYIRKKDDSEGELSHYIRFVQLLTGYKVISMKGKLVDSTDKNSDPPLVKYTIEYENNNGVLTTPYQYDDTKDLLSADWWKIAAPKGGDLDGKYSTMLKALTASLQKGGPISGTAVNDMFNLKDVYRTEIGKLNKFPTFTCMSQGNANKNSKTAESDEKEDAK